MILDTTVSAQTDHLSDTVDVRQVYKQIQGIVLKKRYFLIETLVLKEQINWKTFIQALIMLGFGGGGIKISLAKK